ncbi:endo-exonuclease [Armillaria luteobubalina]|uniref:Endo-exonuclease n=1 Tax=Armillaria luteobubalina TaxID=153913 RepID=A0AA39Q049_9AGAR|nr:endo-exonuclease [Armillaria luteobubalina]
MLKSLFIVTCLLLLGSHALPTELSSVTTAWNATEFGMTESAAYTFTLDYMSYPQSCENICFSWFCNKGPRSVAPDRTHAAAHRASNSCGKPKVNRCSTRAGHASGYQCDEWPWANSNAGGSNAATRCIPSSDNAGSGAQWGNFVNVGLLSWQREIRNNIPCLRIQNKGSQASGYVADGVFVTIKVSNIPKTAHFCLGEIGLPVPGCASDAGQPMLQQIG